LAVDISLTEFNSLKYSVQKHFSYGNTHSEIR
jgi:hypothetical protein